MLFEQPANVDISGGASESGKANSYFDGLPAGCYLASLISDKGGRKMPMIVMYLLAAVMALCFSAFYDNFYSVALCGFLLSVFNMAGGFIMFSYTAESYPTHMRSSVPADRNRVDCPLPIYAIFIRTLLCNYD
ncbi:MAG: hypothetical protein LBO64_10720 [Desulfovibrio sp.]|nr:hypothetical protein [Desulfovibrio sp.]